ncbi:pentatricopeptide repeat-containing protein At1g52640, mitochondrial-like [Phragmites australis]|uniref:pentatricopeptide repeat-containing protein At1g52640, mitochondrial-like n=1 Tax=Phragmites australis TaxID=29695 RepID=UPI002D767ADC|nr:pentatricopeptide repeat-containing protein At1g52640, mitochondrial-like [Phragmites australis]
MQSAARSLASSAAAALPRRLLPRSPRALLLRGLCSASPKPMDPRPDPDPDSQLVGALCRVLSDFRGPQHDLRAALRGFEARLTPAAAAAVLRRCRNLPLPSLRFFLSTASLPGFSHLPDSLLVLANSLAGARLFPLLRSLLSDLPPSALSRDLFPLLFRAYARAGLPDDAIRAFSSMEGFGFPPVLADLHSLLFALSHNGLVEHAEAFFRESATQFDVSAKTYTILISGWAVVSKPENARKLFDEIVQRGVEPDIPAYNALIDALCRGGDVALAQEQLKDMQRSRGLVPDAATYGPFLRSACASKDAHAALRVLDRMRARDLTPNVFTYNAVIRLLCELGEVDEAYNILCEMASRGEKPDVWSYNTLLNAHCKLKEANMDSEPSSQNPTDMTAFVQNLLGQMQTRFESMSQNIVSKIDEMGTKIDELEQSINDLKAEMGTEMPAKKPDEAKPNDSA